MPSVAQMTTGELFRSFAREAMRSRGSAHRHRFALQLCALRTLGTFIDDVSKLPVRITNHVGRQLGLSPLLFLEDHDRPATATEQAQRIREYVGYRPFDDDAEGRLKSWLSDRVAEGAATSSLPGSWPPPVSPDRTAGAR